MADQPDLSPAHRYVQTPPLPMCQRPPTRPRVHQRWGSISIICGIGLTAPAAQLAMAAGTLILLIALPDEWVLE